MGQVMASQVQEMFSILAELGLALFCGILIAKKTTALAPVRKAGTNGIFYDSGADPQPGNKTLVAGTPLKTAWQKYRVSKVAKVLVICAGDCDNCALRTIKLASINWKRWSQVFVVFQSSFIKLAQRKGKNFPGWHVIADPWGAISTPLNAVWTPRAYVFSGSGEILHVESSTEDSRKYGIQ